MWKVYDFSLTQILREINFSESRSSKTAFFAILEALNLSNLCSRFQSSKIAKMHRNQNSEPSNVSKRQIFHFLESLKLISRKI